MKKGLMIIAVLALGFNACKKDDDGSGTAPKTTSEKIVGKWKGDKVDFSITIPPAAPQMQSEDISYLNVEFKSNGTVVADSAGFDPETLTWSLIGDTKMIFDGDTMDIQSLTDNNFNFGGTQTEDFGGGVMVTIEQSIKLKK